MGLWRTKSRHSQHSDENVDAAAPKKGDLNSIAAENDLTASATQAAGTEWLAGHPGHLTAEQEEKLVNFKALVEEKGYYTPSKDGQPANHSEQTLVYVSHSDVVLEASTNEFWGPESVDTFAHASSTSTVPTSSSPRRKNGGRPTILMSFLTISTSSHLTRQGGCIPNGPVAVTDEAFPCISSRSST
jgi:hypothetical protein